MAKLNERNSKFVVIQSEFHGGRCIGFYNSLKYAKRIVAQNTIDDCHCGRVRTYCQLIRLPIPN